MKTNKAFTLIELLVVVLIIGILAAIAVPQYQKAVAKSRAAQLQTIASSAVSAVEEYFLATGQYPVSFDQLTLSYPLKPATKTTCHISTSSNSSVVKGDDFEFVLNTVGTGFYFLTAQFIKGDHKCTGFTYPIQTAQLPLNQLLCMEDSRTQHRGSKNQRGDFCEKVMGKTFLKNIYSYYFFK